MVARAFGVLSSASSSSAKGPEWATVVARDSGLHMLMAWTFSRHTCSGEGQDQGQLWYMSNFRGPGCWHILMQFWVLTAGTHMVMIADYGSQGWRSIDIWLRGLVVV